MHLVLLTQQVHTNKKGFKKPITLLQFLFVKLTPPQFFPKMLGKNRKIFIYLTQNNFGLSFFACIYGKNNGLKNRKKYIFFIEK